MSIFVSMSISPEPHKTFKNACAAFGFKQNEMNVNERFLLKKYFDSGTLNTSEASIFVQIYSKICYFITFPKM